MRFWLRKSLQFAVFGFKSLLIGYSFFVDTRLVAIGSAEQKRFDDSGKQSYDGSETIMKTIPLRPDRQAELEEFARRRGKTPADALDEALATYLEWEQQDFEEAVRGIQQGHDDVKAGRTRPANEYLKDIRQKNGISR